jgi:hypothetical protein
MRAGVGRRRPSSSGGGYRRAAEAVVGRWRLSPGGGGRRRELVLRRDPVRERAGERESIGGGEVRARARGAGARGGFRPSPALSKCEARIELLYRAGLRGVFRSNWALLDSVDPG